MGMINQIGADIQSNNLFSLFVLGNLQMRKQITSNTTDDQIPQQDPFAKTSLPLGCTDET